MNNAIVKRTLALFLLLAFQILVCNHIFVLGFINPDIYLLSILLLPISLPLSAQYSIAFAIGLCVDIFDFTLGIHATASLFLIALRPLIIKILSVNKIKTGETVPSPKTKDFLWLLYYTLIMVFIHQSFTCMLEIWSFNHFAMTALTIAINTLITSLLILCIEYIFIPRKSNHKQSI